MNRAMVGFMQCQSASRLQFHSDPGAAKGPQAGRNQQPTVGGVVDHSHAGNEKHYGGP